MNLDARRLAERLLENEFDMAFRRRALFLLDALELGHGLAVLDVGCGQGWYLHALSRLADLELAAVESDPARVAEARAHAPAADVRHADAHALPFPEASFDRVLMSEVLEHLREDHRALREAWRVLRPGGILAVSVPNARFPLAWDPVNPLWIAMGGRPIRDGPVAGIWSNHQRLYTREQLAAAVEAAEFELEWVEELTHYCLPLSALLIYGIGKPLIERRMLPAALHRAADRFTAEQNSGTLANPLNLLRRPFEWVDSLNERPRGRGKATTVNVVAKARRPE